MVMMTTSVLSHAACFVNIFWFADTDFEYQPLWIFMWPNKKPQAFQNIFKPDEWIIPTIRIPKW